MNYRWLFLWVALYACQSKEKLSAEDAAAVRANVEQALHQYHEAIAKDGLLAEFKYLDSSSDFFWAPPGFNTALTYDSVAAILRRNAGGLASVRNRFDTLQVIALSKSTAVYNARLQSMITDTAGQTNQHQFMETGVLIKRSGGWKLLCGQTKLIE